MKKILLGMIIFSLIISLQTIRAEEPGNYEKIVSAVKGFIISKRPEWGREKIDISLKYAQDIIASLSKDDDCSFSVSDAYQITKITPNMILPIVVEKDGERIKTINLLAQIEVYKDVLVAKKYIKKGTIVQKDDLKIEMRDIANFSQNYMDDYDQAVGKITRFSIPEGRIVFDYLIKSLPVVNRGEMVKILVKLPNLIVETYGIALEEGQIGDNIKVRREDSKKSFQALIISSSEVEVLI
jgi:flagella basal body P-ring formation protein FlgA